MTMHDPKSLRRAFGRFATGVTVVTARAANGDPVGFTANSFSSVSLDPPLLLVCVATAIRSYPAFSSARSFAVNVLAENQRDISNIFASRGADKFGAVTWRAAASGAPLLDDVVAWFDCSIHQRIPAGDHGILVGRIESFAENDQPPLGFCGGAYLQFGLLQRAMEITNRHGRLRVGAVLECDGNLLLETDPTTGRLTVPAASRLGSPSDHEGLYGLLASAGYSISVPFLFAVYEDGDTHYVVHRGQATATGHARTASSIRPFPLTGLPWERIARPAERMMLERYQRERSTNVAGIYVGTAESGDLHTVSTRYTI